MPISMLREGWRSQNICSVLLLLRVLGNMKPSAIRYSRTNHFGKSLIDMSKNTCDLISQLSSAPKIQAQQISDVKKARRTTRSDSALQDRQDGHNLWMIGAQEKRDDTKHCMLHDGQNVAALALHGKEARHRAGRADTWRSCRPECTYAVLLTCRSDCTEVVRQSSSVVCDDVGELNGVRDSQLRFVGLDSEQVFFSGNARHGRARMSWHEVHERMCRYAVDCMRC